MWKVSNYHTYHYTKRLMGMPAHCQWNKLLNMMRGSSWTHLWYKLLYYLYSVILTLVWCIYYFQLCYLWLNFKCRKLVFSYCSLLFLYHCCSCFIIFEVNLEWYHHHLKGVVEVERETNQSVKKTLLHRGSHLSKIYYINNVILAIIIEWSIM